MSTEIKKEIQLEIAHVLFIDTVGYSKLSINEQHAAVQELNRIVRAAEQFQQAEAANRLIRIPTGDGMVLAPVAVRVRSVSCVAVGPRCGAEVYRCRFPKSCWYRECDHVGLLCCDRRESHALCLSDAVLAAQVPVRFHCQCTAIFVA